MVRCNLSKLMKAEELTLSELSSETGIHRNTLRALCNDTAQRIDISVIDVLCTYFNCTVCKLFTWDK